MLALLIPGVHMGGGAAAAPVFSGTITDISHTENTGTHSYDLGAYFTGATSYSIAPAVETGWTFDTVTGELIVDTDAVGVFGTYVVTGTNATGSDVSNAFSVTITAVVVDTAVSGGWGFLRTYESELRRRREELKKRLALEAETEQIEAPVDREIALLLRRQEAIDDKRKDLERLSALAKQDSNIQAARQYSERVATALERAIRQENYSALEALDRELKRASEEEQFMMLSLMLLLE